MPWDITYHDEEPENPKIGDMWAAPDWAGSNIISNEYKALKKFRPPLMIMIPSTSFKEGDRFLLDRSVSDAKDGHGWTVTIKNLLVDGQKPDITVAPSINCVGSYHGFIRNGVITNDTEGKTYSSS